MEFAKQVPKPKVAAKPQTGANHGRDTFSDGGYGEAGDAMLSGAIGGLTGGAARAGGVSAGGGLSHARSRVDELEAMHSQLKQSADAIRRELGF